MSSASMRWKKLMVIGASLAAMCLGGTSAWSKVPAGAGQTGEAYRPVSMPPGFRVEATELEGPVFADAQGKTLYTWPQHQLRDGPVGDPKGESLCTYVKNATTDGLMDPYPAGLILPDLATRPSCAQEWPLVRAPKGAKPVGSWTIIKRKDGIDQWAYNGQALYTSVLDRKPGDTYGGTTQRTGGDGPGVRVPVGPPADVPPGFGVSSTTLGRLLAYRAFSVYVSDKDGRDHSNCDSVCTQTWEPVLAPETAARSHGAWSVFERAPGIRQWAFRGKPLYTYVYDQRPRGQDGSDVPGWHNVYLQRAPSPPSEFTRQDTTAGVVLADAHGKTIYIYRCGDDALDQLSCDDPDDTQAYRLAMCGGGSVELCLKNFPYVLAPANARSKSRTWTVMEIDPQTGHRAKKGQRGALRVWAYRDRPIYTYAGDKLPGDIYANSNGEYYGNRDGFNAFWIRSAFFGG